jgi:HD-like signal output (HDOD) protein
VNQVENGGYPTIKELSMRVNNLPLLPTVLSEIMALDRKDQNLYEKLVKLVSSEAMLTATILKIANSAVYSVGSNVSTIESAMMRIGTENILQYISTFGLKSAFNATKQSQKNLWQHGLHCALIARMVAKRSMKVKINQQKAYLIALIHDMGSFMMMEHIPFYLEKIESKSFHCEARKCEIENGLLGYDHTEIGYIVCRHWGISEEISELVKYHHSSDDVIERNGGLSRESRHLLTVLRFSDHCTSIIQANYDWHEWDAEYLADVLDEQCHVPIWEWMGVSKIDIAEQLLNLKPEFDQLLNSMNIGDGNESP